MTTIPDNAAEQVLDLIAGDAALIAPTPQPDDNAKPVRDKLLDQIAVLGRQAARGQASLTNVALTFAAAVREKLFTDEDAAAVYNTYAKSLNDMVDGKLANVGLARLEVSKVSISMLRTFGKAAPVANADLYQRVLVLRNQIAKEEWVASSTYVMFVTCNRAVQKGFEASKLIDAKAFAVSDDFLLDAMSKTPRADKTDEQRLADAIATIGKLVKTGRFAGLDQRYDELVAYHKDFGTTKANVAAMVQRTIEGSTLSVH